MLDELELRDDVPSVEELMDSPLSRFITLAANSCGYSGTTKELIVNWVHPLFLKAKAEASKADNPNWWEAMKSPFADEYWKAAVKEIETLEKMDCWDVVDRQREFIQLTPHGHSRSNAILMASSRSSKLDFAFVVTSKSTVLIFSRLMLQWFNGQRFG
jgi:hypothetical protein